MSTRSERIPPYNVVKSPPGSGSGGLSLSRNSSAETTLLASSGGGGRGGGSRFTLDDSFSSLHLSNIEKTSFERKSYEDLMDRCLEQERLLGFDDSIREGANELIKEIESASDSDSSPHNQCGSSSSTTNCSEAGPITADEDINKAEIFQDASEFDFDFLSKIPGRRVIRESRQSLFLKFDPLAQGCPQAEVTALPPSHSPSPLNPRTEEGEDEQGETVVEEMSTPKRCSMTGGGQPTAAGGGGALLASGGGGGLPPGGETGGGGERSAGGPLTPAPAGPPPCSSDFTTPPTSTLSSSKKPSRPPSGTATPILRHDILSKEISKLQDLMMRQESSYQETITACTEEVEELRRRVAELEATGAPGGAAAGARDSEALLQEMTVEAEKLRKQVTENNEQKKQLMLIMEEYEKTISQMVTMREDDRKKFEHEKEQLAGERDEASQHLRNMEIAFNDVHQKYEKCKEAIEKFKHNETQYKFSLAENKKTIQQQEENYLKLKELASTKLEQANKEIDEMRKAHDLEIAKLSAINRKMEVQVKTLEESIEQKKREVAELTKICDELITKVGH